MSLKHILIIGTAVVIGGCASQGGMAEQPREVDVRVVDGAVDPTTAGAKDPNETVCTRRHKVGSNFPRVVCKKRKEWDQDREAARREMDIQRSRNASNRYDKSRNF